MVGIDRQIDWMARTMDIGSVLRELSAVREDMIGEANARKQVLEARDGLDPKRARALLENPKLDMTERVRVLKRLR
jgi:hypothetical protein